MASSSTFINEPSLLIGSHSIDYLWGLVRADLSDRKLRNKPTPPFIIELAEDLRDAVQAQVMSGRGQLAGDIADMRSGLKQKPLLSTEEMAERLYVGERQARRLAAEAGIDQVARNCWKTSDIEELVAQRSRTS